MKIEILDFTEDRYNNRIGYVDIKVIHSIVKHEIFRNIAYFKKEGRTWCAFPNVKRLDKWVPIYEREPVLSKEILPLTLKELNDYFKFHGYNL